MKRLALSLVAAVALVSGLGRTSFAFDWSMSASDQNVFASTTQLPLVAIGDCSGQCACDDGCCDSCGGAIIYDVELTLLRYGQEGGVTDASAFSGSFDYEIAPRFELGYLRDDGLGIRQRLWWFDHSTVSEIGNPIEVDTYLIDVEFFQLLDLCQATSLEFAGGVRYLNFDILLGDAVFPVQGHFDGFGLTTALNLRRQVLSGNVYVKTRLSLLTGDIQTRDDIFDTTTGFDHSLAQIELGLGYEVARYLDSGIVLRLRAGLEMQQWMSIVPLDPLPGGFANDDTVADASFFGFVSGIGIDY